MNPQIPRRFILSTTIPFTRILGLSEAWLRIVCGLLNLVNLLITDSGATWEPLLTLHSAIISSCHAIGN
jgi:hypothetical protein